VYIFRRVMQSVTRNAWIPSLVGILLSASSATALARPWPAREPAREPKPAHQLRNPSTWPAEPALPAPIDPTKFQQSFAHLCNVDVDSRVAALAPQILQAATAASTDPFTLSALALFTSHCDPKLHKDGAYGLLGIQPGMYRSPDAPPPPVDKDKLSVRRLLDPATNIEVGAMLLAYWQSHHKDIDEAFGGAAHRDGVSHIVWGDDVKSSGQEDLILTARRRMIFNYLGTTDAPRPAPVGIDVVPPLEGSPRVAPSGPGDDRDGGARRHRGLDIAGTIGEPVRSIADGTVVFAGVNMPNKHRNGPIPPDKIRRYRNRRLGVGGIYLCIEHKAEPKRVMSCYMHLDSYVVSERDEVKAGQLIGFVGRTGVKVSPPHLHLEVRVDERFTNPAKTLGNTIIPPSATQTHLYVLRAMHRRRLRV
jgi:hypothetical protein